MAQSFDINKIIIIFLHIWLACLYISGTLIYVRCQTYHCRWPGVLSKANTQRTWSPVSWFVIFKFTTFMMEWHTISRVVVQHLRICLHSGSGKAPTYCASTLCMYWTRQVRHWPSLIVKGTMYNLTHLSGVLSTPNPGVVDEKVFTQFSLFWFSV